MEIIVTSSDKGIHHPGIEKNPPKSYAQVAEEIGNWCSGSAIQKWMKYYGCVQLVQIKIPLLNSNKKKNMYSSVNTSQNWGLL